MTKLSPKDYMYDQTMVHTTVVTRRQWFSCTILRTMPLSLRKELLWLEWWLPMKFLIQLLQTVWWGPFELEGGLKKAMQKSPSKKEENLLELSSLESWMEENKEKALNLFMEYHDIFALEDGETGFTEAAKHKIKVMDPKPFKERPRNIPSGLLER